MVAPGASLGWGVKRNFFSLEGDTFGNTRANHSQIVAGSNSISCFSKIEMNSS